MLGPVGLFAGCGFRVFFATGEGAVVSHGVITGSGAWF